MSQLIFRNRRQQVVLNRVREAVSAGRTDEVLEDLQHLLESDHDSFCWVGDPVRLSSVRREAARLLSELPAEGLKAYEDRFGIDASIAWEQARKSGAPAAAADVVRRYFHTRAGFEALDYLASRAFDRGAYGQAARLWGRAVKSPPHQRRVTRAMKLKYAAARRFADKSLPVNELAGELRETPLPVAGTRVEPPLWLARLSGPPFDGSVPSDWPVFLGNRARNGAADATTPFLKLQWSVPVSPPRLGSQSGPHELDRLLADWESERIKASQSVAVANHALVVREQVIFRDFQGIRGVHVRDGRPLWSYDCDSSLVTSALEQIERSGASRPAYLLTARLFSDFESVYTGNSTLGTLASDGNLVFAVDGFDFATQRRTVRNRSPFGPPAAREADDGNLTSDANLLIALPLPDARATAPGESVSPQWTIGGPPGSDRPLAGHFFLGPPLPVDGVLYAMTEFDRQLNLAAINAETGRLLWVQGLAYANQSVGVDSRRAALACSPTFSDGILVCPTQADLLIGVDAVSGSPLWAYYSGDAPIRAGQLRRTASVSYGQLGFCGTPQVADGRVVEMPRHSRYIHCVDLQTGEPLWKTPRFSPEPTGRPGNGDEYVAAVVGDVVLIVGMQVCRGLSLETGEVLWSRAFGTPSGRGVLVGDEYLLPLEEGRIATIAVDTGEQIGFSLPRGTDEGDALRSFWRPGNLIAHGEMIVSTGVYGVSAFPQSEPLLARARRKLKKQPDSAHDLLLAAELELNLGGLDASHALLERCLSFPLKQSQRAQAETLFRELLYLKLEENPDDAGAVLSRLKVFSDSPLHRARYLIEQSEWQLRNRNFAGILESVHELVDLDRSGLLPDARDPSLRVAARSWARGMLRRMRETADDQERNRIDEIVLTRQQDALDTGTIPGMQSFLAEFTEWPHAAPVRQRLAEELIGAARFQEAELLLLQNRGDSDLSIAAEATATLVELWDDRRLFGEAAQLLQEMDGRYAEAELSDGPTGRTFTESFPKDSMTWQIYQSTMESDAPARVSIVQRHWDQTNAEMENAYRQTRGHFAWPDRSDLALVNKGTSRDSVLAAVDRQTGLIVGRCKIPRRTSYPSWARHTRLGHLLPLGGTATMYGVSLLHMADEEPLWSMSFEPLEPRDERMRVGPAAPGVCVFQGRGYLVAVEPATGQVLWQRSELSPDCGLFVNQSVGLIGDEEAIAVFDADRASYSVYRTMTGEFVRRGRLSIDVRYLSQSRAFGRRLVYVSSAPGNRRLQVLDPLTGRIEFDLPFTSKIMTTVTPDNELAVVLPDGTLRILDVEKGIFRLKWRFNPKSLLAAGRSTSNVVVFADEENYYVNFQKRPYRRINRQPRYHSYYTTTHFPRSTVQADLFAISKQTGEVRWRRQLPQRTVLRAPQHGLPYLILLSYVRDLRRGNRNSVLVEVIDRHTGETIGLRDGLVPDRFVELSVHGSADHVELHGFNSRIDIDAQPDPRESPQIPTPLLPDTLEPSAFR